MAPNNALRRDKPDVKGTTATGTGSTTVLLKGTVESRGIGVRNDTRSKVQREIDAFLQGEASFSLLSESRAFFTVWTFITRFPGPTWVDHHPGYLMRGMAYFPAAGCLVGFFTATFFEFAAVTLQLPASVAACISTVAGTQAGGCFHEDGLGDTCDGVGGGWSRQQILTIMTDTRLGTYGCVGLILYFIAKIELLTALASASDSSGRMTGAGSALIAAHTLARCSSPYMIHCFAYVDEAGPKNQFYSFMVQARQLVTWYRVGAATLFSYFVTAYLYDVITSMILLVAVLLMAHVAGGYATYLLGGVMGDYLGATVCVTEILVLTLILILTSMDMPRTWEAMWTSLARFLATEEKLVVLQWTMEKAAHPDHPVGALARFVGLVVLTALWCSFVGHPSVFVRESVVNAQEEDDGDLRISLPKSNNDAKRLCPSREAAEKVCKSRLASFRDRYDAVCMYLDALAKPVGSLGTLEDWAARLAALQQSTTVAPDPVLCLIFAGDHGAAADPSDGGEGCSAFPQAVTRCVLDGLERGISGASVLAKQNGVSHIRVVDVGVVGESYSDTNRVVVSASGKLHGGTRNFCSGPAMMVQEAERCVQIGRDELAHYLSHTCAKVVVLGEVGIGNTTASSALVSHLAHVSVESVCGGGATTTRSAEKASIDKKIMIVTKALKLHSEIDSPMDALAKLGGAEIAALVGAILEASERGLPVLIDGFIVTAAALVAGCISPPACRIMFLATKSTERGQSAAIDAIRELARKNDVLAPANPVLDMGLRMGEATGALVALPILRSAAEVLNSMGTIADILGDSNGS